MARDYDDQFLLTLLLTGFFFILMHLILSYTVVRFRGGRGPASYWHGNIKWVWAVIIVMALLDLGLAVGSESLWAKLHLTGSPPDVLQIEVVGQQFVWTSRYKGPDGRFGRVKRDLVDEAINILGVDPADPAGKDDVVLPTVFVPLGRPVELLLESTDVIHRTAAQAGCGARDENSAAVHRRPRRPLRSRLCRAVRIGASTDANFPRGPRTRGV